MQKKGMEQRRNKKEGLMDEGQDEQKEGVHERKEGKKDGQKGKQR